MAACCAAGHPACAGLHARRGTTHAELGHWAAAAADLGQDSEREPDDARIRYFQALVELAAGDTSG